MATKSKKYNGNGKDDDKWPYGPRNYYMFAAAMLVIIVGFFSLAKGSITLAPILLVLGYCVLLPMALIMKGKPDKGETAQPDQP